MKDKCLCVLPVLLPRAEEHYNNRFKFLLISSNIDEVGSSGVANKTGRGLFKGPAGVDLGFSLGSMCWPNTLWDQGKG